MKKIILLCTVAFFSISVKAQTHTINIYCTVRIGGYVTYFKNLDKVLPDSIKNVVLIDPKKQYNIKDSYDVILFMTANNWKLVTIYSNEYILEKEIFLDETAWKLYIENIKNLETKKK